MQKTRFCGKPFVFFAYLCGENEPVCRKRIVGESILKILTAWFCKFFVKIAIFEQKVHLKKNTYTNIQVFSFF
jgi:hypothetical protein